MKELVITNIGTIVTGKLTDPITDCNTIAIRDGMIAEIGGEELLKNDYAAAAKHMHEHIKNAKSYAMKKYIG